jgi:hypothetical protein
MVSPVMPVGVWCLSWVKLYTKGMETFIEMGYNQFTTHGVCS